MRHVSGEEEASSVATRMLRDAETAMHQPDQFIANCNIEPWLNLVEIAAGVLDDQCIWIGA